MGRCARRAKKVGKVIGRALTPMGVRLIGDIVGQIAGTDLSNEAKRDAAYAAIRASFKTAGIDAREHMIRLGQEYAVAALKQGSQALSDLGQADDGDLAPEDDEPTD